MAPPLALLVTGLAALSAMAGMAESWDGRYLNFSEITYGEAALQPIGATPV